MKSHTKRRWMESIKHLDSYLVTFLNHMQSCHVTFVRANKSCMCCNLENIL